MNKKLQRIQEGFQTAFIDYNHNSELSYRPQFISNDYKEGRKVISSIEEELKYCDEFFISVAFITEGGIAPLLQTFKELEKRNIKGRILTTDYLNFSEPKALRKLNELSNIELRMYCVGGNNAGFHTKGYMFREGEIYKIIVGSSNMTMKALSVNKEWNTKIIATENGEYVREMRIEFQNLWEQARPLEGWIDTYTAIYEEQKKIAKQSEKLVSLEQYKLEPNTMQVSFIENLNAIIKEGEKRALLISATGTGKTYASAFAIRQLKPHRVLFLVHREQIAKQAKKAYKNVFGDTKSYGLISGSNKDFDKDLLFATVQTMSKDESLKQFGPEDFDVIVMDEVHRAGAKSHQKIMEYFKPKLFLGMTASPERTDGFDIFSLFDHNIAYEIRLNQALEEDLLCPFHYFGISEIEINGEVFDDETGLRNFNRLVSDDRVNHIIEQAEYYGYSGERVKGLIFCSSKKEAQILSEKFNERGYSTLDLSGEDNQETREKAIERLVSDEAENHLDYIFTVDIFNEGVDIPEINQVIMLRPTQSPIVFVQQLGRGLRKNEDKEFVVILDFIGNYKNNFMIPMALSGDRSYNKDTIRRYVASGTRVIPGSSSVHFDEISRKRIYESIDKARTIDVKLIKESYKNLKYRLGHIPSLLDFDRYGSIDVTKIFDNSNLGSYHNFLSKYDKEDYHVELSSKEEQALTYISQKYAKGKRIHELLLLKCILDGAEDIIRDFREKLEAEYEIKVSDKDEESAINNLRFEFLKTQEREKIIFNFIEEIESKICVSQEFEDMIKNPEFKAMVTDAIEFGIHKYKENYSERYKETNFQLYQKYTYEDVCRLLNWDKNMNALNIGGYFYDKKTKTLPVFINYEKDHDAIAYEDRFLSNKELIALSKSKRTAESSDAVHIYKSSDDDKDNKIYLFVRKNKDDGEAKEFYFLGEINAVGKPHPIVMDKTGYDAFEITYLLDHPIREDIYEYIVGE